jgi:hypothetical protein
MVVYCDRKNMCGKSWEKLTAESSYCIAGDGERGLLSVVPVIYAVYAKFEPYEFTSLVLDPLYSGMC